MAFREGEQDTRLALLLDGNRYSPDKRFVFERENMFLPALWQEHRAFSEALGREYDPDDYLNRAYDVVSDYFTLHWNRETWGQNDIEKYLQQIEFNIKTSLMERYHVTESSLEYEIGSDGHLYAKGASEPVINMFIRGVLHRRHLGTPEGEREEAELLGFDSIDRFMADSETPDGTSVVSFSPRGIVPDTVYTGRFIDVFTKTSRNGESHVKLTRKAVDYDYSQYSNKALNLQPSFFESYDGEPLDAWFLSHPISTTQDISTLFELGKGMDWKTFKNLYQDDILQTAIREYLNQIQNPIHSVELRRKLARQFNIIVNRADELEELYTRQTHDVSLESSITLFEQPTVDFNMAAYLAHLGLKTPKVIQGGGCPASRGYDLFGVGNPFEAGSVEEFYSLNSVSQFGVTTGNGIQETWEYHTGDCVVCKQEKVAVGPCNICKSCEKKFD